MATENPQAGCNAIVEILRERQLALPFVKPFKWQGEVWPGKYVCRFEKGCTLPPRSGPYRLAGTRACT